MSKTLPRVLITGIELGEADRERLRAAAGDLRLEFVDRLDPDNLDDVVAIAGRVPDELAAAPALRWNHLWSAGADGTLKTAIARRDDVVLTASLGNGGIPLAEHAVLLMLLLDRGGWRWADGQRERRWDHFLHGELYGRTLGLIGLGTAGKHLARIGAGLGMRVIGVSRSGAPVEGVEVLPLARLDELLAESDAVVVTAPSTDQSRGMLGDVQFRAMKPTAWYINVSRGDIADRPAMLRALQEGWIAGAGLDAHAIEPLPDDAPEWSLPNVIVTPHNGSSSHGSKARAIAVFEEDLRRFAAGQPLRAVVDKEAGY